LHINTKVFSLLLRINRIKIKVMIPQQGLVTKQGLMSPDQGLAFHPACIPDELPESYDIGGKER
jgi:hypothetical protein